MANVLMNNDLLCKEAIYEFYHASRGFNQLPEKPATHWVEFTLELSDLMSTIEDVSQRCISPVVQELIAKLNGAEGRFHPVLAPATIDHSRQTFNGIHMLLIQMPPDFSDKTTFRLAVAYC